jgi:acyl-coenzyme A synthetase/AMP-(fatty) acid ligase
MFLMDDEARGELSRIEHMLVGGEAFSAQLSEDLRRLLPGKITNMYGPTETTIWSATHDVDGEGGAVPIGRPIANTRLYVLDDRCQPLPPGVSGELYIAGDGVARGYLGRKELTTERFVPDPFAGCESARMYRTGDLVRYRDDGVLEFIGRGDHQVKVRGHRIELGEIEARLAGSEQVNECVVTVREDSPGDRRIVGYFVGDESRVDQTSLRERLREKLPDYMVPSHLIQMDALPLTPNGKIDRTSLPAPETSQAGPRLVYAAPENETEKTLVEAWQDVLGLDRIGTQDNFFDIGGHSLLVVKVHRELRRLLDLPVSITDLYRFPTIRSLTEHLTSTGTSDVMQASSDRALRRREMMQRRRRAGA